MNYLGAISKANGGAFVVLSPDDCDRIDTMIDKAINKAFERGKDAANAISHILGENALKPIYSYKEVCSMFSICERTIYNWAREGKIKTSGMGRKRYVAGESITTIYNLINNNNGSKNN